GRRGRVPRPPGPRSCPRLGGFRQGVRLLSRGTDAPAPRRARMTRNQTAFLFDLDGTLIDSVYQHVLAWREALQEVGISLSVWKIHRRIGMSGGLFVAALARELETPLDGDTLAALPGLHADAFIRRYDSVQPLPGAREL